MKRKAYISGKITGLDIHQAFDNFKKASETALAYFNSKGENYMMVNMMEGHQIKMSWADYMIRDLMHLKYCDTIVLMSNHSDSHGSNVELEFAKAMNMRIITLDDDFNVISDELSE